MSTQFSQLEAIIIGALQGVTEFLPVSSSAHLILYSYFTKGDPLPLSYNVALHFGTALALLVYFSSDWIKLLSSFFKTRKDSYQDRQIFFKLVVSSIPAGFLGFAFKHLIEKYLHSPKVLVLPLFFFGILLWLVDKYKTQTKKSLDLSYGEAFLIGLGQSLALIPGTSRSCASILTARLCGLERKEAIRFSFLMGTPIMLAAALLHISDFCEALSDPVFYTGLVSSFVVGLLSIYFFLRFFARFGFFSFALYRIILAVVLFISLRS